MRKTSQIIFLLVILLCLGHAAWYYPLLPDRVASHFNAAGRPDAWSDKASFIKSYLFVVAFMAVLFSGIGSLLKRVPDSLINLPNKAYWLAPDRREETIDSLSGRFLSFGSATLLLLLALLHQSFMVHLGRTQTLGHPLATLGIYILFSVLWSIGLIARFYKID